MPRAYLTAAILTLAAAACNKPQPLPTDAGVGPDPQLPAPSYSVIAAMGLSHPARWGANEAPTAAAGLTVTRFAFGLNHPRWLYVLPNGDVLVAETDGPGEVVKRPKDLVMRMAMHSVDAEKPRHHRILLLRDADGDGVAEGKSVFIDNLHSPFGMTLVGNDFYVANTDALLRFPYRKGATSIAAPAVRVTDLPAGDINHHWTKNVIASRDGSRLFVTVGSNSNVAENGLDKEIGRAVIWQVNPKTGAKSIFASGIRNPNGMDWEPTTGALWVVANERDELGDDLVPDYITSVRRGGFYGWPYSYYGQHVDIRVRPQRPDLVARAIKPDYAIGSHMGSLGFVFSNGKVLTPAYAEGAFVGQHGSWNRSVQQGYRVIFIPFKNGKPAGMPQVVLSGFLRPDGRTHGRPVGVVIDDRGGLLVADDQGNSIWRVAARR